MYIYFESNNLEGNAIEEFLEAGKNLNYYEGNDNILIFFQVYYEVYEFFFLKYFFKLKLYEEGKNYFLNLLNQFSNQLKFHQFHSYVLFFSYLSKNYEKIDNLLNQFMIITNFKERKLSLNFSMFAFYKGELLLNQEKFIHAAFSFGYNLITVLNNKEKYIDLFQIESIKRICLLIQILPKEFSDLFTNLLGKFKKLGGFKELNPYLTLDNNAFENFIILSKQDLKQSHIYGLSKIVLKEIRFKQIQNILKKYKRITLSKVTSLCGIEYPIVKGILEYYVSKNKINVKFDESEDIIEVIDAETNYSLEELQEYYKYLNQICFELYNYDKMRIKEIKMINQLSHEQKLLRYNNMNEDRLSDELEDDDN